MRALRGFGYPPGVYSPSRADLASRLVAVTGPSPDKTLQLRRSAPGEKRVQPPARVVFDSRLLLRSGLGVQQVRGCLRSRRSEPGRTEDTLSRPSRRTAVGEFAVNNNGWHATNSVLFRLLCYLGVAHIMNGDFTGFTRDPSHHRDCLLAGSTACAKHFDLSFRSHCSVPFH